MSKYEEVCESIQFAESRGHILTYCEVSREEWLELSLELSPFDRMFQSVLGLKIKVREC